MQKKGNKKHKSASAMTGATTEGVGGGGGGGWATGRRKDMLKWFAFNTAHTGTEGEGRWG